MSRLKSREKYLCIILCLKDLNYSFNEIINLLTFTCIKLSRRNYPKQLMMISDHNRLAMVSIHISCTIRIFRVLRLSLLEQHLSLQQYN